jgi:predicted CopG family antitoxin
MMTKVISLSEEAYRRLKQKKAQGESFSDVVVRLTSDSGGTSLLALKGGWAGDDLDRVARTLSEEREKAKGRELRP